MKIGLSLSGGGAKGIAHVGVIQALADHGVTVDIVAGTSAGAIVGALFAAGIPASRMLEAIRNASLFRIFRFLWPDRGLGDMTYLKQFLTRLIVTDSFESLHKPLYVPVMNINTGLIEIKNKGKLFDIVCASSSVPLLFRPMEMDGNYYLDGGIGMNMPVRCMIGKVDLIIGVNLVNHHIIDNKYISSWKEIMSRVFDLSVYNNVKPEMELCDLVIEPIDIHLYSRFNFSDSEKLYKAGYDGAMLKMPALIRMIKSFQESDD
ncbi:MAG: patatin-like phospholipase family protein [Saprospiraceae bacterium]